MPKPSSPSRITPTKRRKLSVLDETKAKVERLVASVARDRRGFFASSTELDRLIELLTCVATFNRINHSRLILGTDIIRSNGDVSFDPR